MHIFSDTMGSYGRRGGCSPVRLPLLVYQALALTDGCLIYCKRPDISAWKEDGV